MKRLGKITSANFGKGGYQDAMVGFSFVLQGRDWSTQEFIGAWAGDPSSAAKWRKEDKIIALGNYCSTVGDLILEARVNNLNSLVGIPVEVEFEDNKLKSWRILTEVLPD